MIAPVVEEDELERARRRAPDERAQTTCSSCVDWAGWAGLTFFAAVIWLMIVVPD